MIVQVKQNHETQRGFWFDLFDEYGRQFGYVYGEDSGTASISLHTCKTGVPKDVEGCYMNREYAAEALSRAFGSAFTEEYKYLLTHSKAVR